MNGKPAASILILVILFFVLVTLAGACLYSIPLCFVRRFHKPLQLLTLNVCITILIGGLFWAIYLIMNSFFYDIFWTTRSCVPILYLEIVTNCLFLYVGNVVTINRLFTILYHNKSLFQSNRWVAICVTSQWILAIVLPTPTLFTDVSYCLSVGFEYPYRMYSTVVVAMMPTIGLAVTNLIIFIYIRRSSKRVRPNYRNNQQRSILSKRDVCLLKHMIFILVIIVIGWGPIYIVTIFNSYVIFPYAIYVSFRLLPVISSLIEVMDLFWYNHELRQYLKGQLRMHRRIHTATILR